MITRGTHTNEINTWGQRAVLQFLLEDSPSFPNPKTTPSTLFENGNLVNATPLGAPKRVQQVADLKIFGELLKC